MTKSGFEVRMPLHQNGDSSIIFRPDLKSIILLFTIITTVIGLSVGGINWYKASQCNIQDCIVLDRRVDTLEVIVNAEQASQTVLMEAIIKKIMPESADIIIKQAEEIKAGVIRTIEKQQRKEGLK